MNILSLEILIKNNVVLSQEEKTYWLDYVPSLDKEGKERLKRIFLQNNKDFLFIQNELSEKLKKINKNFMTSFEQKGNIEIQLKDLAKYT